MTDALCNQGTGVWPPLAAVIEEAQTASKGEVVTWNYRIGCNLWNGAPYYSLVEVYYEPDGSVLGFCGADPYYFETAEGLREALVMMAKDSAAPVLDLDEIAGRVDQWGVK
jgi:hypothetical protein